MIKISRFNTLVFILFTILPAFATALEVSEIKKSPNDSRLYRTIELDNKLQVLLVSDKDADKAAAAMDVAVGSASDPEALPGLAHFLEHMLFLGTKKYPNADEYQSYIDEHSGSHNAFTTLEHTNFFFEIDANFLEGALDRFSQQFTAPLFSKKYVEREKNAVHSEFTSGLKDDGRRFYAALKQTLDKDHPYSRFTVGNLSTLKDQPDQSLRQALLNFYQQHYSANIMKLVIIGKNPLSQLEDLARKKFSNIPNHQLKRKEIDQPFFKKGSLPMKILVEPIMDKRTMTVAFPIPSSYQFRKSKPAQYLANLIGHEGQGSLLSSLKSHGLVNSLSAGDSFDTHHQAIFTISMDLTENGLEKQDDILKRLFAYIDLVKNKGIRRLYFDENRQILKTAFIFKEKEPAIHSASRLASLMQDYAPNDVLLAGYDLESFNTKAITDFADHLTPDNMVVAVSAKGVETTQTTKWYQTPYKISQLKKDEIKSLMTKYSDFPELNLPAKNNFISENFSLISEKNTPHPSLLSKSEHSTLWYSADTSFRTPKANFFINFRSPIANDSARHANLIDLLTSMLNDNLGEFSYPASLAGLQYDLYNHIRGISVKIGGYSDKQAILLEKILISLKDSPLKSERFLLHKERLVRALKNAKKAKPYNQTISKTRQILVNPSWSEEQRLDQINDLKLIDLVEFRKDFFKKSEVVMLANGNISRASALGMQQVTEALILNTSQNVSVSRAKVRKLPSDNLILENLSLDHPDTAITYYLQGNEKSFKERALYMLLGQILSTPYYADIRTNKQLGYIVFATDFELFEVPGIAFIVQSPKASASELLTDTIAFLKESKLYIDGLSDTKFKQFKKSIQVKLLEKDKTISQRSNRYWQEIDKNNLLFNSRQQLVKEIKRLSKNDFQTFYKGILNNADNGLLVYSDSNNSEDSIFDQINQLKVENLKENQFF